MPSFFFNDREIKFEKGDDILTAVLKSGEFIPHYCYHESLTRSATCRMCMIEITDAGNGRPIPKLQTACSTPAAEGIKVIGKGEKVEEARHAVMEFLLVNHPLDCAICDQAGECSLQEYSFKYGTGISQVTHEKRVYGWRDIGSFLQLERNRCIHCTRCVRFTQEISDSHEMGVFQRNHQLTVDTFVDQPLTDNYQGNLADICPVGAITLKDARFRKRIWKLKSTNAICDGCARGCNIFAQHEKNRVYRFKPREHQGINRWWMCDIGRISFHKYFETTKRQIDCFEAGQITLRKNAIRQAGEVLRENCDQFALIVGSPKHSVEEQVALKEFARLLFAKHRLIAPKPEEDLNTDAFDGPVIKNLFLKDRTPNSKGLSLLEYQSVDPRSNLQEIIDKDNPRTLILCSSSLWADADPAIFKQFKNIILFDIFCSKLTDLTTVSFPITSYLEKIGHFINVDGFVQRSEAAVCSFGDGKDLCKTLADLVAEISNEIEFSEDSAVFFEKFAKENALNKFLRFPQTFSETIGA